MKMKKEYLPFGLLILSVVTLFTYIFIYVPSCNKYSVGDMVQCKLTKRQGMVTEVPHFFDSDYRIKIKTKLKYLDAVDEKSIKYNLFASIVNSSGQVTYDYLSQGELEDVQ